MDTTSYLLFACDIISGIIFVVFIVYVFLKKNAATIQRKITKLGSKIRSNLKVKYSSQQTLQSPTSLQLNGQNDSPISTTERIMSTDGLISTERFMSTEGFMSTERASPTDRFMSTDRPFSPLIKVYQTEDEISPEKREELLVVSPANQTEANLFVFSSHTRKSSVPLDFQTNEFPDENPDFRQFAEILKDETRNRPRRSPRTKIDRVF